jgi:hypothetical protein
MSLSIRAHSSTSRFTEMRGQDRVRIVPASGKVIHSGSRSLAPSPGLQMIRWRVLPCFLSPTTSTDWPTSG